MDSIENLNMKDSTKLKPNHTKICETQETVASETESSSKTFTVDKSLSPLICRRLKFVRYSTRNADEDMKLTNKSIRKRQKIS
ncbi:unnamed protein product [Blepharisma stoltei]|uniref:Uncharacterized protein n=1 Tax=Blepharisma stoltei TaxID=1481888 RepID=A0AAU9IXW3_9CILI|nr:unnamed protein product [Blepharisma stoltei]